MLNLEEEYKKIASLDKTILICEGLPIDDDPRSIELRKQEIEKLHRAKEFPSLGITLHTFRQKYGIK